MSGLPSISIVGTGPVGRALAEAHARAGGRVAGVLSRDRGRAEELARTCGARAAEEAAELPACDAVLVCVPDRAIAEAGRRLAAAARPGTLLLHTSGALPGSALLPAGRADAGAPRVGSLHPLQTFRRAAAPSAGAPDSAATVPPPLAGVHWFHEGDGEDVARRLVAAWGGTFHTLAPGGKALYHAGAAVLSNHAVALFADATRLLAASGVPPEDARPALAALLEGTAANLRAVGAPGALTGPVARGDAETVVRHVRAIAAAAPDLLESYRAMARRAVVLAEEKGSVDAATAARLLDALSDSAEA